MAKLVWSLKLNGTTDFTNKVISVNITSGRQKYLDSYSGGSAQITINNANNYASNFIYGNYILIADSAGNFSQWFWIQEINFEDSPGNTGFPTATILAVDWIGRAGRVNAENLVMAQDGACVQFTYFESPYGPLPSDMSVNATVGSSIASAITYTGTVTNYLNYLVATERNFVWMKNNQIRMIARNFIKDQVASTVNFAPTTDVANLKIGYETFKRIQNGVQFVNVATISSSGIIDQTAKNSSSISNNGPAFYSNSTVDYNATQALGNANWIANNFSDPSSLRFEISFSDRQENNINLILWMKECFFTPGATKIINLIYQIPQGSLTNLLCVIEGFTLNIDTSQTSFYLNLSPLQYYQFFTLNSSTLGILNTSRLGW